MPDSHPLQASVESRGLSAQYNSPVLTAGNREWTGPLNPACLSRLTVRYVADSQAVVTSWTVVALEDGLDTPLPLFGGTTDGTTPLQIVSEGDDELVVDCYVRYPNPPTGRFPGDPSWSPDTILNQDPVMVRVTAVTDTAGTLTRDIPIDCRPLVPVLEKNNTVRALGIGCIPAKWEVISVVDAGPFSSGGEPSSSGKMFTVGFTNCQLLTSVTPEEYGDPCCDLSPTDTGSDSGLAWAAIASAAPPRGSAWRTGPTTPLVRLPGAAGGLGTPGGAATPSGYRIDAYQEYEVFIGECSEYLTTTATEDWDFDSTDPNTNTSIEYQDAVLLRLSADGNPLAEADLDLETSDSASGPSGTSSAVATNNRVKVTSSRCLDCCECGPDSVEEDFDPADIPRYVAARYSTVTCKHETPGIPGDPFFVDTTTTYEHEIVEYDLEYSGNPNRCGVVLGAVPTGLSMERVRYRSHHPGAYVSVTQPPQSSSCSSQSFGPDECGVAVGVTGGSNRFNSGDGRLGNTNQNEWFQPSNAPPQQDPPVCDSYWSGGPGGVDNPNALFESSLPCDTNSDGSQNDAFVFADYAGGSQARLASNFVEWGGGPGKHNCACVVNQEIGTLINPVNWRTCNAPGYTAITGFVCNPEGNPGLSGAGFPATIDDNLEQLLDQNACADYSICVPSAWLSLPGTVYAVSGKRTITSSSSLGSSTTELPRSSPDPVANGEILGVSTIRSCIYCQPVFFGSPGFTYGAYSGC